MVCQSPVHLSQTQISRLDGFQILDIEVKILTDGSLHLQNIENQAYTKFWILELNFVDETSIEVSTFHTEFLPQVTLRIVYHEKKFKN